MNPGIITRTLPLEGGGGESGRNLICVRMIHTKIVLIASGFGLKCVLRIGEGARQKLAVLL